jgi:hypothetical protein
MHRHTLSDREWNLIAPLLPQQAHTGRPAKNHRMVIDALLWPAKTGGTVAGSARTIWAVAHGGDAVLPLDSIRVVGAHPCRAAQDGGRQGRH